MSIEHTPGKVTVERRSLASSVYVIYGADGERIAKTVDDPIVSQGAREANARRLGACWNACDGISTDLLEGFSPRFLATYPDKVLAERRALEAQRDELRDGLAALEMFVRLAGPGSDAAAQAAANARALIAKHKVKAAPTLHYNCTVQRRMLVTNSVFSPTAGAMTPTGEEWVTQPCGSPLFDTPAQTAGVCQSCADGWSHPNNYRADGPRPRAATAPAHENSLESPEAGLLSNLPHDA